MSPDLNSEPPQADASIHHAVRSRLKLAGVIPAFNAAAVVTEAIDSLLHQTVPLDEIIVVDDGSTDDTASVAERTGVRVIRQTNGGPNMARNTAIRATDADWIFLLDADDVSYPERVAIQVRHLGDPKVGLLCGNAPEGSAMEITHALLWKRNQVITSSVALRRRAWEDVGGFNESRTLIGAEDYNLWLRLTWRGWKVVRLDQPLARYQETETSLTRQIDRCLRGELENVRLLREEFGLAIKDVRAKEHLVLLQYGLDTFHERNFALARQYLGCASRLGSLSLPNYLRLWLSYLPALARHLP